MMDSKGFCPKCGSTRKDGMFIMNPPMNMGNPQWIDIFDCNGYNTSEGRHFCPAAIAKDNAALRELAKRAVEHIRREATVLSDESGCYRCPHYIKHPKIPYICRATKLLQPTSADCPRAALLADAEKLLNEGGEVKG